MYNQEDSELILNKLKQYFIQQTKHVEKRMTREEYFQILNEKDKSKIEFSIFQKFILDCQMKSHEKYLSTFIQHFKQQDQDQNGIIDENEFAQLIKELNIGINDQDIQRQDRSIQLLINNIFLMRSIIFSTISTRNKCPYHLKKISSENF
ncbi:unnamed protein product [Paramecium primaurelia]|uniref:EF-hand domain-containing protein n=1 Tax=Paramecium primaurelia TaxID=5886 RepID=A0A8S1LK83_PARPR|nr:unnamed protein product [Paramecium primaurelia]